MGLTPEHVAQARLLADLALACVPLAFGLSITVSVLALAWRAVEIILTAPIQPPPNKEPPCK